MISPAFQSSSIKPFRSVSMSYVPYRKNMKWFTLRMEYFPIFITTPSWSICLVEQQRINLIITE